MKYAVISDIHSNLEALSVVLAEIDRIGVDETVCLGDVVGYNGNPNECVALLRERGIPTICGNHDAVACSLTEPWGFNPIALSAALWTRDNLEEEHVEWLRNLPDLARFGHFLAVHGSPLDRDVYMFGWEDVLPHLDFVKEQERSLCFFGHTHCPGVFSDNGAYSLDGDGAFQVDRAVIDHTDSRVFFINPGSVGQPRDGDVRAAFGLLDTESGDYRLVRLAYPVKEAADRVIEAGLPRFLAERLYLGR